MLQQIITNDIGGAKPAGQILRSILTITEMHPA